jgi:glycosyltransferase involved in cell wall biosynthesis
MNPYSHHPKQYRFHLLGLVHLPVSERYMGCAFTQKIVKLSKMLLSLGHEVILYGSEGSDAPCTEFIQTHTLRDIRQEWGSGDNRFEIGYDWKSEGFRHDFNTERTATWLKWVQATITAIQARKLPDDFLLLMQGYYQKPVADAVQLYLTCEPGIGYRGVIRPPQEYTVGPFHAFESEYLRNFVSGGWFPGQSINGIYYDKVIPNYFDEKDFPLYEGERGDYFLFIGRLILRKGVDTALKTVQAVGGRLLIAGQGDMRDTVQDADRHLLKEDFWEHIGYVGPEQRAELMGKAKAVFVPTKYLEAFGGVNVEAQLCGTPVITTDFGVFPETVIHGVTGFRGSVLQNFVDAARKVDDLDPQVIRDHASRYLMKNVRHEFNQWFRELYQLHLSAVDGTNTGWHYYE